MERTISGTDTRRVERTMSGMDTRRRLHQGRIQEGVEITISGTDTRMVEGELYQGRIQEGWGENYIRDGYKKGWR